MAGFALFKGAEPFTKVSQKPICFNSRKVSSITAEFVKLVRSLCCHVDPITLLQSMGDTVNNDGRVWQGNALISAVGPAIQHMDLAECYCAEI